VEVLTPAQVKELWPLCDTDGIIGAIRHPDDGYIQPADLTQAMAKGRALPRGGDLPQHHGHGHRGPAQRGMAGADRPGRHRLRARGVGHRQLRPPHGRHGGARNPGDPRGAPVHRDRAAPGGAGAPPAGPARDGRAARGGFLLVPARGERRLHPRPLRGGRSLLLPGRAGRQFRIRAVPGGPGAAGAPYRGRHGAGPRLRGSGRQEGL
jgi:hypothetical protein